MISTPFIQNTVASFSRFNKIRGMTNIFISHGWDKELMLSTNYLGLKAGDVVYAKSTDKRVQFNNLRLRLTHPTRPKVGVGGLHAYTNDLVLPEAFYHEPLKYLVISNKPFDGATSNQVTYTLPDGKKVMAPPLKPPAWVGIPEEKAHGKPAAPEKKVDPENKKTTVRAGTEKTPVQTTNVSPVKAGAGQFVKIILVLAVAFFVYKFFIQK